MANTTIGRDGSGRRVGRHSTPDVGLRLGSGQKFLVSSSVDHRWAQVRERHRAIQATAVDSKQEIEVKHHQDFVIFT